MIGLSLGIMLQATLAAPEGEWRMEEFMISGWGGPTDEATAAAFVDAGFGTVMSSVEHLDLCRAYGLRAILFGATPEFAAEHRGDEAIWGYYVWDEPKSEEFEQAGERVAVFYEADPTHPAYVNLMAWMDLDDYFAKVKPWFLSYDYYQWWWGSQNHFGRLSAHREAALAAGVPLICWVEANADKRYEWGEEGAGYLPDNEAKLRQSVMTALAYGVKGIQWFTTGLAIGPDGTLSQSGQDIKGINADLQALGPILIGLQSVDVWHTAPVPDGQRPLPGDGHVTTSAEDLVIGAFVDPQDGAEYLLVINRRVDAPVQAGLVVRDAERLDALDGDTGAWEPLDPAGAEISLQPGDGVLLRLR